MKTRVFNGGDVVKFCNVWRQNADAFPDRFRSSDYGALEAFFFGSHFFDPKSVFVAIDDENPAKPLGFIVASFGPDENRDALDTKIGVLYAPILSTNLDADARRLVSERLIVDAENYLRAQGSQLVYAGGNPTGSPLFTGLYSPCSSPGLYENDSNGAFFERQGFVQDSFFNEYRLSLDQYCRPNDREFLEAQNVYLEPVPDFWKSRANWFDVNVYAHFSSRQWLLTNPGAGILAGAITHTLNLPPLSSADAEPRRKIVLGFFAVRKNFVRRRVGSVLLAGVVKGLRQLCVSGEICVVVPEKDEGLCGFFASQSFRLARRFISRRKNLDASRF